MEQKWPQEIWLVRHGQSAGNVARDAAEAASGHLIDIAERDVDVPLSELGIRQSQALASWFAALAPGQRPSVVLHSPYVRAAETANILMRRLERESLLAVHADERLREKEFGILDRLTTHGIAHKYPELYAQRQHVGKFHISARPAAKAGATSSCACAAYSTPSPANTAANGFSSSPTR